MKQHVVRCDCGDNRQVLYHGTNCDIVHFDVSMARPYNVGFYFVTRAAAIARIDYLRGHDAQVPFRLIKCRIDIRNPFRIDDVFGHSYTMIFDVLQQKIGRATSVASPLRTEIVKLTDEYMDIEDDPNRAPGTNGYETYCHHLNADIIRIFSALGYDGVVYENELEDAEGKADSYVIFDCQNAVVESVQYTDAKTP